MLNKKTKNNIKKIEVECELFGALTSKYKKNKFFIPRGTTYKNLLIKYLRFDKRYLKYFSIIRNDKKTVSLYDKILINQKITVLLPLSGG